MKAAPFGYEAPAGIPEALALLEEYGDEAKLLAGGQSLVPLLALRLAVPAMLIDLGRISELENVHANDDGSLSLGAMVTHRRVETMMAPGTASCRLIGEAIPHIGHVAIRNRGTVGGSLCHADPAAEWGAVALALDAECDIAGTEGGRVISALDLFSSYLLTTLKPTEILTRVNIRIPAPSSGQAFVEIARRHGDFALAGCAAVVDVDDDFQVIRSRVAILGGAPTALLSKGCDEALIERTLSPESIADAAESVVADIDPSDDIHASRAIRTNLIKVAIKRALSSVLEQLEEKRRT